MNTKAIDIFIPSYIQCALERLEEAGFEAYLVGGCVRDALLGETPEDYDITTSALPAQMKALFEADYEIIENGIKHGTVTPIIDHKPVEITTFRIDGSYSDNRHPDSVAFSTRLSDDLSRRDFTVNAMAYSRERGLVDCFGGVEDLHNGIIRCVGDADKRFEEDSLRILRALRFAAVLGFSIEEATARSINSRIETVKNVSVERIYAELKKLLDGDYSDKVLAAFPCLTETLFEISLSEKKLQALQKNNGYAYKLAVIFAGEDTQKLLYLKPDNKTLRYLNTLLDLYALPLTEDLKDSRNMAAFAAKRQIDDSMLTDLLLLHADLEEGFSFSEYYESFLAAEAAELPLRVSELAVDGEDLLGLGLRGKAIKESLNALLFAVIEGKVPNEKEALLAWLS